MGPQLGLSQGRESGAGCYSLAYQWRRAPERYTPGPMPRAVGSAALLCLTGGFFLLSSPFVPPTSSTKVLERGCKRFFPPAARGCRLGMRVLPSAQIEPAGGTMPAPAGSFCVFSRSLRPRGRRLASLAPEDGAPSDQPSGFTAGPSAVGLARAALWARAPRLLGVGLATPEPVRAQSDLGGPVIVSGQGGGTILATLVPWRSTSRKDCEDAGHVVADAWSDRPLWESRRAQGPMLRVPADCLSGDPAVRSRRPAARLAAAGGSAGARLARHNCTKKRGWWQPRNRAARRAGRWRCRDRTWTLRNQEGKQQCEGRCLCWRS